jgi:hypothetical protein
MEVIVLFGSSILVFGPGFLAAVIAWKKGYRPWFWFLAMGPIGLLWILLTPNIAQATTPEERERWETRTDWSGGILSGFTLLPMFALPLLGMAFYALAARPARAPMPVTPIAVTMPVVTVEEPPDPTVKSEIESPNAEAKNEDGSAESK